MGFLDPVVGMSLLFRNMAFCVYILGPWDFSSGDNLIFVEVSVRVRYGEEPQTF